jgi:hypothetical protein
METGMGQLEAATTGQPIGYGGLDTLYFQAFHRAENNPG